MTREAKQEFIQLSRIFCVVTSVLSFLGMLTILQLIFIRYQIDSVSIGLETSFLDWSPIFPAVSICLTKGRSSNGITQFIKNSNISYNGSVVQYVRYIHSYMFTNPNQQTISEKECQGLNSTCGVDIDHINSKFLPQSCSTFLSNLSYDGKVYSNCEDVFKFHKTELGNCFIANSMVDIADGTSNRSLTLGIESIDKSLGMYLKNFDLYSYMLYVLSPDDIPFFNSDSILFPKEPVVYNYNLEEIHNDFDVKDKSVAQRGCKFLKKDALPYSKHEVPEFNRKGFSYIRINIVDFPIIRYKRVVTQTKLDLIGTNLSIGGVVGLFFGASILNIIDVLYNWLKRMKIMISNTNKTSKTNKTDY